RRTLAGVRPPGLAVCWQLYRSLLLTRGEKPRDAAWTSLIPVEACRPLNHWIFRKYSTRYHAPRRAARTDLSISRRTSRSRRADRLSWSFLPRARPSSTLARPALSDLTSVPLSTRPASTVSRISYSCRARRLVATGRSPEISLA